MAQITSREELEEWIKDKPADWAQVIAARAALRVLPYAFAKRIPDSWVATYSLALFRATTISWAAGNFPAHNMSGAAHSAAADAYSAAAIAIFTAADVAYSAAAAAIAAAADAPYSVVNAVADAADSAARPATWANIIADCNWLTNAGDVASASRCLTREKLWTAAEPYGLGAGRTFAIRRLAALKDGNDRNQNYQVWIDWYNRRIEGHDAAFDIPGDNDRTEDKKILARLANATNEDFWDKGATYVNITLQSWIDEAREQVTTQGEESAPEPQNADVIQFRQTDAGQFDPDFSAVSDELLTDQAAYDRHCAFVTTARDALSLCRGHNQIGHVAEHLTIVIDAAGDQPRTMRVDLLVARGERMVDDLRDAINELQPDPEVALGNLREKRIVNVFNALIRDYTAMIKLDPALDRRQRLPHYDEENASAVSPQQALIFVNSSVTVGAITQSARDVIVESARGLTENGDVKDRKKWRFSETVRNLPRAMIGFLWQHRVGIVGSSVAGVSAVSMALITQEAAIRSFFATNPGMLSIIDELVGIVRGIGM